MPTLRLSSKAAILLAAVLVLPGASPKLLLESDDEASQGYLLGEDQELTTHIPFSMTRAGGFYAKMLVTPWNPVNDNTPNGTVDGDGWWVEFFFLDDSGELLERDAKGQAVNAEQGGRIDTTPTDVIELPANTPYRLGVTVHMPADAAVLDGYWDVPVALVFRDLEEDTARASGAGLEQSQGFRVIMDWDAALSDVATPGVPQLIEPVKQGENPQPGTPARDGGALTVSPLENTSPWIWVVLAALLLVFLARREYQIYRLRKDMESVLMGLEISGFYDYAAWKTSQTGAPEGAPDDDTPGPDIIPTD